MNRQEAIQKAETWAKKAEREENSARQASKATIALAYATLAPSLPNLNMPDARPFTDATQR